MELGPALLAVEPLGAGRAVAEADAVQGRVVVEVVHLDCQGAAPEAGHVAEHLEGGLGVLQLDLELALGAPRDDVAHPPFGGAGPDGQEEVVAVDGDLAGARRGRARAVGERDVIDVDVAPAPAAPVHDLEGARLAEEFRDVPGPPAQPLGAAGIAVGAGDGADDAAFDPEVQAGLVVETAAPDEGVQVRPLDDERRAGEPAGGVVAPDVAAGQAPAEVALDGHLVRQGAERGGRAEGRAGNGPGGVILALEVGQDDVGAGGLVSRRGGDQEENGQAGEHGGTAPAGGLGFVRGWGRRAEFTAEARRAGRGRAAAVAWVRSVPGGAGWVRLAGRGVARGMMVATQAVLRGGVGGRPGSVGGEAIGFVRTGHGS